MSDDAALLAAILAHPDEDTPRLMYADWLQENGQPDRAEFIRIQCDPTADEAAEDRAAELEEQHRAKWLMGLPQFVGARWEFRRGFPEYLDSYTRDFCDRYDACFRAPWLRFLSLVKTKDGFRDFLNRRWNPRWVELELDADTPSGHVIALANNPQASQLRRIELVMSFVTPDAIAALAESPHLEQLRRLHLYGDRDGARYAPLREHFGDRLVFN